MNAELGKLTAYLAEPNDDRIQELTELINRNINPPDVLRKEDVIIRAMYIVSDEINSYGGKFSAEELNRIKSLIVDSPVLIGHRKDRLPVGRNFHAELEERDGRLWVKSYFYWLRTAKGASDLKENIDGGIYKECSIGFTFSFPECSVCKKDIRSCQHEPFQKYTSNENEICFFSYKQVDKVLETSLVYRGAVPDTSVSKELRFLESENNTSQNKIVKLESLSELSDDFLYLVTPLYESIFVSVSGNKNGVEYKDENSNKLDISFCADFKLSENEIVHGHLVGYRGKERCSKKQLMKYIENKSGSVTRLELKLLPTKDAEFTEYINSLNNRMLKFIPHERVAYNDLPIAIEKMRTKEGVVIWQIDNQENIRQGCFYKFEKSAKLSANSYSLESGRDSQQNVLTIYLNGTKKRFNLNHFNINRFLKGSRFIADEIEKPQSELLLSRNRLTGNLISVKQNDDSFICQLDGVLSGRIVIQKAVLKGRKRFLIYRLVSM